MWEWYLARRGESAGERDLWIARHTETGRRVELLLAADLSPGRIFNASGDAAAERARIRQELLEWASRADQWGSGYGDLTDALSAALDRICPEEG